MQIICLVFEFRKYGVKNIWIYMTSHNHFTNTAVHPFVGR